MANFKSPLPPLSFLLLLAFLLLIIQLGIITLIFEKLGLSKVGAFILLLASLSGSFVNIPLFSVRAEVNKPREIQFWQRLWGVSPAFQPDKTIIAVNVGGCLIPVVFSLYLLVRVGLPILDVLQAAGVVALISFMFSRPIPGMGIAMPILIAPVTAALASLTINAEQSAPLAYISGTLGVLIGADILRMYDVKNFQTPLASIGGAGTFDGIFITGIVAVLLT